MKMFLSLFLIFAVLIGAAPGQAPRSSKIEFVATDKDGTAVTDLSKEDIVIRIDGRDLSLDSFALQSRQEIAFAVAVDSSGSLRPVFEDVRKGARAIFANSAPEHEAMLMRFVSSNKIQTTPGFSANKSTMMDLVMRFEVEAGQTAIIDALYLAAERVSLHRQNCSECGRAVVVITDGDERGSLRTKDVLINLLRRENVEVYFLGLIGHLYAEKGFTSRSGRGKAEDLIKDISQVSGGAYMLVKEAANLEKAAAQMTILLGRRYVAEYVSPSLGPKKIELKLTKTSRRKDITFHYRRP